MKLLVSLLSFSLVACIGPLADLDHERESAVVSSSLQIGELSFSADGQTWSSDPTAGCEISEARKDDLHNKGSFAFVVAGNEADPVVFGTTLYLAPDGRLSAYQGLYAHGQSDWRSQRDACTTQVTRTDYEERSFAFSIDCTFERNEGAETLRVHGSVDASRCFDPKAISATRVKELASSIGQTSIALGEAFAEDPVGFATSIALLPLYAMGGGH